MENFGIKKLYIIEGVLILIGMIVLIKIGIIMNDDEITQVAVSRGQYTLSSVSSYGTIYDYRMNTLNNESIKYEAVINPNDDSVIRVQPYVKDYDIYYSGIKGNLPFLCEITSDEVQRDGVIVFKTYVRNTENQLAPHILGYTSENKGVYGLEKSYDEFLRENKETNTAKFSIDAVGGVLSGLESSVNYSNDINAGVITTLDKDIQRIAEKAMDNCGYEKGAVVVMDTKTGEIRASVSYPDFDIMNVESYLESSDANFINRAFSSYSVGSIFKLVTAAAALESGISSDYTYTCTGSININGREFNCHKWGGHGEINMATAMVESCNTYFIALSEYIDRHTFIETAEKLGFGEGTKLCDNMTSDDGYIQSPFEILVPAERANLSFGQGKLLATPLQICRMTACLANNGFICEPKLIIGTMDKNGVITYTDTTEKAEKVLSEKTISELKRFMIMTANKENSGALPTRTGAAGKTSTAQTGVFKADGSEIVNCWFTGYFPVSEPKYAVTVLIEDGYSGNEAAAPVFREIADEVIKLQLERKER